MTVADNSDETNDRKAVPKFKQPLHDEDLNAGTDIKLVCRAEGFPVPKVKWYRNEELINATIGKYTLSVSSLCGHFTKNCCFFPISPIGTRLSPMNLFF